MTEPVKRYSYGYHDDGFGGRHLGLIEKDGGDLVLYADYARLEQECAELSERYGKLQTGEGHITHRVIAERDAALKQVRIDALLIISRAILAKLQHPTASVHAGDMWKLENALKLFDETPSAGSQKEQGE